MRTRGTLLQRIGDSENTHAWYEFVYYYRGYIYSISRKTGASHHDAQEIVQQVLMKISSVIKTFEYSPEKGRFRNYLARITVNTTLNHFRSQHKNVSLSEITESVSEDLRENSAIDELAEEEWVNHLSRIAWKNVSVSFGDNVKQTWEMLCKGQSVEEIAAQLQISEKSVYVYKKRVLEKLKPEVKRLQTDLE
jgi:RNA polymerase sigma-70 factor (ECF subfamily)